MPRVVAIAQARMGASRLPNKMMLHLHGYPVVEWVYRRVREAREIDDILFAVPDTENDCILARHLTRLGARVFAGSEPDVVERFFRAARVSEATHVVRVCADNPLICGSEIDHLVRFYFQTPCDYAYNHIPRGNCYPDGLGAEIVSLELLERIDREAERPEQREHVMNYLWDNADDFVIRTFDPPDPVLARPDLRLDLDTCGDYLRLLDCELNITMSARDVVRAFGVKGKP